MVTVELDGGATEEGVVHPTHIHSGPAGGGGGIEMWLTPIDGTRDSTSARVINRSFSELEGFDGHVKIHESVADLGNVISRGDIGANSDSSPQNGWTVVENPRAVEYNLSATDNGFPATATFLEVTSGMSIVTLDLDIDGKTEASVSHPAHIHDSGGIAIPLGSISGNDSDSRGSKLVAQSFDNLTTFDGSINIHQSVSDLGTIVANGGIGANADPVPVSIAKARAEHRTSLYNFEITLQGTVTRAFGSYARMQDMSGPPNGDGPSGIVIRQTVDGSPAVDFRTDISNDNIQSGTELEVTGTPSQSDGLVRINNDDLSTYRVLEQGTEPAPQEVSVADLYETSGEDYESVLVRIQGLSFPNASGFFEAQTTYEVEDEEGSVFNFRVQDSEETSLLQESIPTGTFTYEGVVGQFNDLSGRDAHFGYRLIPIQTETALPVELTSFDAVQNGSSVELTWQTASETNNAGFGVQRETESGWTTLTFVEGKGSEGTTTEAKSYRYTVTRELEPGPHRFRLQQEDLDGSTSLSDVVTVDVGMDEALSLGAPSPNPVSERATLSFAVKEATETSVAVYNVLGQKITTLYDGTPQAEQQNTVDLKASGLPSGVYFVRLKADGQTETQRLTVVR